MNEVPSFMLPNFEVLGLLGRGGMASVWKARQISLDRYVAVKILSSSFSTDPEDIRRFRQEARTAAQLKHPGIVQIYDANFSDGVYYFVMELVDGYTMGELLRRKGRVTEEDALIVAESVALALDYAWSHYQMVHCDIKPDNIMVDADGALKVTDLGLCRSVTLAKGDHRGGMRTRSSGPLPTCRPNRSTAATSSIAARTSMSWVPHCTTWSRAGCCFRARRMTR